MNLATPGDLVALIAIGSAILAGLLWLIRAQTALQKEFKPNGGHSTRDSLDRIERDIRDVRFRLDKHIDEHNR